MLQATFFIQETGFNDYFLLPLPLIIGIVAVFGALIGSFLNVVIYRLPRDIFFQSTFSRCPSCDAPIKFYDNIPVISYLLLRGRCRNCRAPISARYPSVEALTALLFAVVAYVDLTRGDLLALPFDLMFVAAMLALIFIDAEFMILPNKITYPGFVVALLVRFIVPNIYGVGVINRMFFDDLSTDGIPSHVSVLTASVSNSLLGAIIGAGSLWFIGWAWKRLRGVDAMGMGDVKMMLMVGAYLGWSLTLLTIFIGFFTGAVGGTIAMYKSGKRDLSMQLPFGIFLGAGAIVSLLYGAQIIDWYLGQFR